MEESDDGYYTDSIDKTDIKLLEEDQREPAAGIQTALGDILVRIQTTKFKKLKFHTHENVGYGEINLPPEEMHTRSLMLLFTADSKGGRCFSALPEAERPFVLRRLGNLVRNVAPVFLLCDFRDLGIAERIKDPVYDCPVLYAYDSYPGGTGLAEGFLNNLEAILRGALEQAAACPCRQGCPSCIGPAEGELTFNAKQSVLDLFRGWLG